MRKFRFIFPMLLVLLSSAGFAQTNANQVLQGVFNKLQKAKDYFVQATIKLDMPFIRMLPVNAKIYYKQKDKFKVESKGIAVVPRQGFDQISKMLEDTSRFTAMMQGTEMLDSNRVALINVIPLSDTSDLVLAKLWINTAQNLVVKSQLSTKSNGTILTEYTYGSQLAYGLPDKMIFSVDVKKFKIPKGVTTDINKTGEEKEKAEKERGNKKGKIFITLSNYEVNKGIPDNFFQKEKK